MEPKKCEFNKPAICGFGAIAIYSFCCGSWLLAITLIFVIAIHLVDVRRKNRHYYSWLDKKEKQAKMLEQRRVR